MNSVMAQIEGTDKKMVANNMEPHYLTHPGEVIKEELEFRGISQRRLAAEIGVPVSQLNEVLNAKRSLNAEMALLIEQALGIDAEPLLSLQVKYNILSAKRNKPFFERLKKIPRIAAAL
jgi:addiction module HigA family antidote